ncbi:hypothetical protein D3C73_842630 [compost metagenome]
MDYIRIKIDFRPIELLFPKILHRQQMLAVTLFYLFIKMINNKYNQANENERIADIGWYACPNRWQNNNFKICSSGDDISIGIFSFDGKNITSRCEFSEIHPLIAGDINPIVIKTFHLIAVMNRMGGLIMKCRHIETKG